jgi:hypothetical protein
VPYGFEKGRELANRCRDRVAARGRAGWLYETTVLTAAVSCRRVARNSSVVCSSRPIAHDGVATLSKDYAYVIADIKGQTRAPADVAIEQTRRHRACPQDTPGEP